MANPTVVVEVLSPATIDYDLGEKFEQYRQISSLKAVVYVWQDRRQIEIRARTGGGDWRRDHRRRRRLAAIESSACTLDVDALYARAGVDSRTGRDRRPRQRDVAAVDEAPFDG